MVSFDNEVMDPEDDLPMPALVVQSTQDEVEAFLGEPSLENPATVARGWLQAALDGDQDFFDLLCDNPGDLAMHEVRDMLGMDSALLSHVHLSEDRPDDLVAMMVVKDFADEPVVLLGPVLVMAYALLMVRQTDGSWRVWRFGGELPKVDGVVLD
jgi:hypothetical protein